MKDLLLAQRVRDACIAAGAEAYEDALMRGLCAEGAWEAAVHAMRDVDLEAIVSQASEADASDSKP